MRWTSRGAAEREKRHSQGMSFGAWLGRSASGPKGSKSQPGTRQNTPGTAAGTTSVMPIPPAFPKEALSPSGSRSTTVTPSPSFRR